MGRTDTGPWPVHFPTCLLFPFLRIGFTGLIGTHTQWKRLTSTLANSVQSWEITHTGPMTSTSITHIDSRLVSELHLNCRLFCLFLLFILNQRALLVIFVSGENPCSSHYLTCSHLCLIGPGGQEASCECPDHFIGLAVGFKIQCVADCSSTQFRCGDNEKSVLCKKSQIPFRQCSRLQLCSYSLHSSQIFVK